MWGDWFGEGAMPPSQKKTILIFRFQNNRFWCNLSGLIDLLVSDKSGQIHGIRSLYCRLNCTVKNCLSVKSSRGVNPHQFPPEYTTADPDLIWGEIPQKCPFPIYKWFFGPTLRLSHLFNFLINSQLHKIHRVPGK